MSAHLPVRHRADRLPIDRAALALIAAASLSGGACVWATAVAQAANRALVATCTGGAAILFCAAVTIATYGLQTARQLRERIAAMDLKVARLADETMPAVVKRLRDGASADTALAEIAGPADGAQQRILRTLVREVGRGERMRDAAMSACANAAGRVQALATSMLAELREMENRYGEEVLGDLMKLDHSTAQAGRLADSIAVLTGARSGRRWTKPIVMESILRGAVGRISAYQRVRVHSTSTVAVAGYAAEGVMHALAELMDNATSFSPPSDQVHVYVEEVYAGVIVTIEDAGLVMSPVALERAERSVSSQPLDLTTLSGTRLGLAVVGCLARKHGLTVSFRPSSRGGTGVVVIIPRHLITQVPQDATGGVPRTGGTAVRRGTPIRPAVAAPAQDSRSVQGSSSRETPVAASTDVEASTQNAASAEDGSPPGLPRRRRGQTLSAASAPTTAAKPRTRQSASDAGARFSAFRQATEAGRSGGVAESSTEDETSDPSSR